MGVLAAALKIKNMVTPGTPASGVTALYTKADGNLYRKTSDGVESAAGVAIIPTKSPTENANTYPVGASMFETGSSGWPEQYGTVETTLHNVNRATQTYGAKSGRVWTRSADSAASNGWTGWREMTAGMGAHSHGIGDLPVAAHDEVSATKLVRADDPRLDQGMINPVAVTSFCRESDQTISNNSWSQVAMINGVETAGFDMTMSAGGSFVTKRKGIFMTNATVMWAGNNSGRRLLRLMINGQEVQRSEIGPDAVAQLSQQVTMMSTLAANDTVTVEVYQSSGGNLNVVGGRHSTNFQAVRLGG